MPFVICREISVKQWLAAPLPCVDAVRPARCPHCDCASHPVGERPQIWGHGSYERPVFLKTARMLRLRRFLCRRCGKTMTVAPAGLLPQLLSPLSWIVRLLALWASGLPSTSVRDAMWPQSSSSAALSWPTLRRWSRHPGICPPGFTSAADEPRARARQLAQAYAGWGHAPPAESTLADRAAAGATRLMASGGT